MNKKMSHFLHDMTHQSNQFKLELKQAEQAKIEVYQSMTQTIRKLILLSLPSPSAHVH